MACSDCRRDLLILNLVEIDESDSFDSRERRYQESAQLVRPCIPVSRQKTRSGADFDQTTLVSLRARFGLLNRFMVLANHSCRLSSGKRGSAKRGKRSMNRDSVAGSAMFIRSNAFK